ncbi:MAG: FAD-dependent oxidoreductase [Firmicutes bacterium HGW-Firmicutes-20]|nr:MAG: FAD-dependent oxidoreductase [Firmicutes bacterium HGW-Firmicutes-20]PKM66597.1 MAG: FAD-dependent oxidoreductase [Firmicutes bacterium HGW-Firmicutes-19]
MNYEKRITNTMRTEVLVIGAGSAGSMAAIASGKEGRKTLLVERYGFLGGTSTTILDTFYGFYIPGSKNKKVVGGIPDLLLDKLKERKSMLLRPNTYGAGTGVTYDPEILKVVWEELVVEANVDILLHSFVADVVMEEKKVKGVIVVNKSGFTLIEADMIIDASGDADVTALAGYPYDGIGSHIPVQSLTTTFRVGNVDEQHMKTFTKNQMWEWMKEANQSGKYHLPREEGSVHITTLPSVMATNMVRLAIPDPTNIIELSKAEILGRRQALEYFRFMKDYLPGYENSVFLNFSTQIGIRETRRIIGEYTLTKEDVLQARKFDDAIVLCGAPIEDHHNQAGTKWEYLEDGETYQVPYRSLIPKDSVNLLVAGRCLSATHDAHASVRSMGQCMGMGQAAGIAASLAVENQCRPIDVNVEMLQQKLRSYGAILEG